MIGISEEEIKLKSHESNQDNKIKTCKWEEKSNYYITQCGNETVVQYKNANFKFCPYCGKLIKEKIK